MFCYFRNRSVFPFELLPDNVIRDILLYIKPKDIYNLYLLNKRFCSLLNDDFFWRCKYARDFDYPAGPPWKDAYKMASFGDVFVFGSNRYGELGTKEAARPYQTFPIQVPRLKAKCAAVGSGYTFILDFQGNVYGAGSNVSKILDLDMSEDEIARYGFVMIRGIKAKAIFANGLDSLFIDLDDNVWVFGRNATGRLGKGYLIYVPRQIEGLKAKKASIGSDFTAIIDLNDDVQILKKDGYNPLGVKAKNVFVCGSILLLVDFRDEIRIFAQSSSGDIRPTNVNFPLPKVKVKSVSAGFLHIITLDLEGNVWVSQKNSLKRLAIKAREVVSSDSCAMIIGLDHSLWTFGLNIDGTMGLLRCDYRRKPARIIGLKAAQVSIGDYHTVVIGKKVRTSFRESLLARIYFAT